MLLAALDARGEELYFLHCFYVTVFTQPRSTCEILAVSISLPMYPQQWTLRGRLGTSEWCHNRTNAVQQRARFTGNEPTPTRSAYRHEEATPRQFSSRSRWPSRD